MDGRGRLHRNHFANWKSYYQGTPAEQKLLRLYRDIDRIRNYWLLPEIAEAVDMLIANLLW
ncbi:class II D-tagatose-bisphosphate aldolase non-catalytic subunit [Tunturiibacter psychrotolerans]|uniref:class II D-tagatose-bisphosphate aldolase non-catalytic subunit n=1 Tax=Tunturiibacter psychrotolerans TaxID=3069686 RepID=UPI003D259823